MRDQSEHESAFRKPSFDERIEALRDELITATLAANQNRQGGAQYALVGAHATFFEDAIPAFEAAIAEVEKSGKKGAITCGLPVLVMALERLRG